MIPLNLLKKHPFHGRLLHGRFYIHMLCSLQFLHKCNNIFIQLVLLVMTLFGMRMEERLGILLTYNELFS